MADVRSRPAKAAVVRFADAPQAGPSIGQDAAREEERTPNSITKKGDEQSIALGAVRPRSQTPGKVRPKSVHGRLESAGDGADPEFSASSPYARRRCFDDASSAPDGRDATASRMASGEGGRDKRAGLRGSREENRHLVAAQTNFIVEQMVLAPTTTPPMTVRSRKGKQPVNLRSASDTVHSLRSKPVEVPALPSLAITRSPGAEPTVDQRQEDQSRISMEGSGDLDLSSEGAAFSSSDLSTQSSALADVSATETSGVDGSDDDDEGDLAAIERQFKYRYAREWMRHVRQHNVEKAQRTHAVNEAILRHRHQIEQTAGTHKAVVERYDELNELRKNLTTGRQKRELKTLLSDRDMVLSGRGNANARDTRNDVEKQVFPKSDSPSTIPPAPELPKNFFGEHSDVAQGTRRRRASVDEQGHKKAHKRRERRKSHRERRRSRLSAQDDKRSSLEGLENEEGETANYSMIPDSLEDKYDNEHLNRRLKFRHRRPSSRQEGNRSRQRVTSSPSPSGRHNRSARNTAPAVLTPSCPGSVVDRTSPVKHRRDSAPSDTSLDAEPCSACVPPRCPSCTSIAKASDPKGLSDNRGRQENYQQEERSPSAHSGPAFDDDSLSCYTGVSSAFSTSCRSSLDRNSSLCTSTDSSELVGLDIMECPEVVSHSVGACDGIDPVAMEEEPLLLARFVQDRTLSLTGQIRRESFTTVSAERETAITPSSHTESIDELSTPVKDEQNETSLADEEKSTTPSAGWCDSDDTYESCSDGESTSEQVASGESSPGMDRSSLVKAQGSCFFDRLPGYVKDRHISIPEQSFNIRSPTRVDEDYKSGKEAFHEFWETFGDEGFGRAAVPEEGDGDGEEEEEENDLHLPPQDKGEFLYWRLLDISECIDGLFSDRFDAAVEAITNQNLTFKAYRDVAGQFLSDESPRAQNIWTVLGFSRHVVRTLPATAEVVSGYTTRLLEEDRALEFVNDSGGWGTMLKNATDEFPERKDSPDSETFDDDGMSGGFLFGKALTDIFRGSSSSIGSGATGSTHSSESGRQLRASVSTSVDQQSPPPDALHIVDFSERQSTRESALVDARQKFVNALNHHKKESGLVRVPEVDCDSDGEFAVETLADSSVFVGDEEEEDATPRPPLPGETRPPVTASNRYVGFGSSASSGSSSTLPGFGHEYHAAEPANNHLSMFSSEDWNGLLEHVRLSMPGSGHQDTEEYTDGDSCSDDFSDSFTDSDSHSRPSSLRSDQRRLTTPDQARSASPREEVPGGEAHETPAAEANADNDAGVFGRIGFWGAWAAGAALLGQSWLKARE